jgi:hypothetical protein
LNISEVKIMSPFFARLAGRLFHSLLSITLFLLLFSHPLHAKTAGLTAIVLYPNQDVQAYQQVADFVLDSKNEMLLCAGAAGIDKNAYHKLGKVTLATGMTLERNSDGVLMLTEPGGAACVVPGNYKFDKGETMTAAQLADKLAIEGRVVSGSDPAAAQMVPIKPGVKIIFVAAPDDELAEYLRDNRQGNIAGWQFYLGKYAAGAHVIDAKKSLAALFVQAGAADLAAYDSTRSSSDPNYAKLKDARVAADQAHALVPADPAAADLGQKIHTDVLALSTAAEEKLSLYQQALKAQSAGYVNLVAAEKLADGASGAEPATPEAAAAESAAKQARGALDATLHECEGHIAAHRMDEAATAIAPLHAFAPEYDRVSKDLQAISALYVAHSKVFAEQPDWPGAVKELEKAEAVYPSPDTEAELKTAQEQALIAANKAAADDATQKSQQAQTSGDIITAYEVLDDLPPDQHALVTDRLATLKDDYVKAAEQAAAGLQKAHEPINGIGDESGIRAAYGYLQRCFQITNDPTLQDRITILGEDLSTYYLQQGKHYAEKPDGTGVNVGWTYLYEALAYKSPTDSSAIHDEMTNARSAHLLKSRLSVKVDFRDQTSRRDAVDFAQQLTDSLATGLESSGVAVKIVRPQETTAVQPNFQMVGDVLQHEMTKSEDVEAKESKYRFGQEEVPNEAWNQANREYERANNDLESARSVLEGAQAHGKKGEIKKAEESVQSDEKKVEDLHASLDMIPKTKMQDVERPYTYSQINYRLKIVVALQFRILDSAGDEVVQTIPIRSDAPKEYSVLQNVKPEDTQGVRIEGVIPNDNDFLEEDEYKARDELIEKAKAQVASLPSVVLARADRKVADGDNDGAAELYILYLDSTAVADTPERLRARKFLTEQFNFRDIGKEAPAE